MKTTLPNIREDLIARLDILRALRSSFDRVQCVELSYYMNSSFMQLNHTVAMRRLNRFIEVMREFLETETIPEGAQNLSGQLAFMFKVYSGAPLTYEDRREGSGFHRRVNVRVKSMPRYLNHQLPGWIDLCRTMQAEFEDFDPQVIENIMIDESLELLGRDQSVTT